MTPYYTVGYLTTLFGMLPIIRDKSHDCEIKWNYIPV